MTLTNEQIVELATEITRSFLGECGEGGLPSERWLRARRRVAVDICLALHAARAARSDAPYDGVISALERMGRP